MSKALIQLAYRQVIDSNNSGIMEKKIFEDSYREFKMKIQAYNLEGQFSRYSDIVAKDGRANSLHYKTSFAVLHHLDALDKKIPVMQDTAGRIRIPFEVAEFKVLESDTLDKSLHKVAITYITGTLTLFEHFGEYLLLAAGDYSQPQANGNVETFTLAMQPGLSIVRYEEVSANTFAYVSRREAEKYKYIHAKMHKRQRN